MSDYFSILQSMSIEDPILIVNIIVIIIAFVLMLWLFWTDFKSYGNEHKDFKSTLVSTGVLGTFIGILIGLWSFDTGDSSSISSSIPKLLDGLKTAFITSIFGMFLAILLSIIQKFKGGNDAEDEITALNNINKQLEKLDRLESIEKYNKTLLPINKTLGSIDTNIEGLSKDISSVKYELKTNQKTLFEFLETKLTTIDNSLTEAVQTLSKGATEEIIKALEGVIQDFNKNLTEQFGDNFKQLNKSVLKMIKWQENYKRSVQEFEKQLKSTTENTEKSHKNTTDLIEKFSNKINKSLQDNVAQNQQANEKTKKILDQLFEKIQKSVSTTTDNAKQISVMTENYAKILDISNHLEKVINTNQNQIKNLEIHLKDLAKIGKDAGGITTELANFSEKIQGSLSNQAQAVARLTAEIEAQLPASLGTLNQSLTSLTKQFSLDYESFLEQVSKLMQANNIN